MKLAAALCALLALTACGLRDGVRADVSRRICFDNGHALGTPGFNTCFRDTFAAASIAAAPVRP